jgi:hypothetical protein
MMCSNLHNFRNVANRVRKLFDNISEAVRPAEKTDVREHKFVASNLYELAPTAVCSIASEPISSITSRVSVRLGDEIAPILRGELFALFSWEKTFSEFVGQL